MKQNQKAIILLAFLLFTLFDPFSYSAHLTAEKTTNSIVQKMRGLPLSQPSTDSHKKLQNITTDTSIEYDKRGPIHIDDYAEFKAVYGFPGNGTQSNPYVLENYHISPSTDSPDYWGDIISIYNTDDFFQIRNCIISGGWSGISLGNVRNVGIYNTSVINNRYSGIEVSSSEDIVLTNNTVVNNSQSGIELWNSWNINISYNTITNCETGISISHSYNNRIVGNVLVNCGFNVERLEAEYYFQTEIVNNTVNGKKFFLWHNYSGKIVPSGAGQVILVNCTNITVFNQNLSNASTGILAISSPELLIYNNTISNNSEGGIYLLESWGSNITKNIIVNNDGDGINLESSGFSIISNNLISNNKESGISLYRSLNNKIMNNNLINDGINFEGDIIENYKQSEVTNNTINGKSLIFWQNITDKTVPDGTGQIILVNCSNITIFNQTLSNVSSGLTSISSSGLFISDNNISNNSDYGIYLFSTWNCTITSNYMSDNSRDGLYLYGSESCTISNNFISGNPKYRGLWHYDSFNTGINLEYSHDSMILGNIISEYKIGIEFYYSWSGVLVNNTIFNNEDYGIYLYTSPKCNLSKNLISDNGNGILFHFSGFSVLVNNSVSNNGELGISFHSSQDNIIMGNELVNNGYYFDGVRIEDFSQVMVTNNTVNGKPVIYWKDRSGGTVPSGSGQVILVNCNSVTVSDQNLSNTSVGLLAILSSNLVIANNTLLYNSRFGIFLTRSYDSSILNNTISQSGWDGIRLKYSDRNNISMNVVEENGRFGMYIRNSHFCEINNNIISYNGEYGIYLQSIFHYSSVTNKIKWNDFIRNNPGGSSQALDNGNNNVFSFNYWQEGIVLSLDADSDGILDDPYSIEGESNNQDHYPLQSSIQPPYELVGLLLLSPNGGEILNGTIRIRWNAVIDYLVYPIIYSFWYSSNYGQSWIHFVLTSEVATVQDIVLRAFNWNTNDVPDGSYLFKVIAEGKDGLRAEDTSDDVFIIQNKIPLPPSIPLDIRIILFLTLVAALIVSLKLSSRK